LVNVDNAGGGILKTTSASLMYAFSMRAAENCTSTWQSRGRFIRKPSIGNLLQFGDQIDPQQGFILPTAETPPDNTTVIFPILAQAWLSDGKASSTGAFP